jgi:hypothetical protein
MDEWLQKTKQITLIEEKRTEYVTVRLPDVREAMAELDTNSKVKFEVLGKTDFR